MNIKTEQSKTISLLKTSVFSSVPTAMSHVVSEYSKMK